MADRLNIIWIFGDQHRRHALSIEGDPNVSTPNIDALAQQGVYSRNALATVPLCCPARGSILTGRYAHHAVPGHEVRLNPEIPTIAAAFNDAGYDTAYFGKWHVDGFHEADGRAAFHTVPRERRGGFSTWLGYENNNSQWDSYVHGHRRVAAGGGAAPEEEVPRYRLDGYETDALTDHLLHYLEMQAPGEQPFFAVLSVQPPHDPYLSPPLFMDRHNPAQVQLRENVPTVKVVRETVQRDLAGYYGMIENLDAAVGRVRTVLDQTGLAETTRIIFFSDHGDMHGSHGQFRKTSPWEEAVRVPFIVGPLGRYHPMRRTSEVPWLIGQPDIAPTTLGLCGIPVPAQMEGFNYAPWLDAALSGRQGPPPIPAAGTPPSAAILQSIIPTGHSHSVDRSWRGIVTLDGWKFVCFDGVPWLLFNLNEDPLEQMNLAHNPRYHRERNRLAGMLAQQLAALGDTFNTGVSPDQPSSTS